MLLVSGQPLSDVHFKEPRLTRHPSSTGALNTFWDRRTRRLARARETSLFHSTELQIIYSGRLGHIPPELFEHILEHMDMVVVAAGVGSPPTQGSMTKQELGVCALVCRYWAHLCRRKIFRQVAIHNAKDIRDLLVFVNYWPTNRFAEYIRQLDITWLMTTQHTSPWLHLLPLLVPKLPNCEPYYVTIQDTSIRRS